MTEAVRAISKWALDQPAVFRISACVDVENLVSHPVLKKAAFAREGVLHRWVLHPNVSADPRDAIMFAKWR